MALVSVARGLLYPTNDFARNLTSATLDAATEKAAHIGRLYINGRPAGSKTLSTGTIQFRTASVTFANGSTTVDIGIQGVASGAGPIAQPDGSFSVKTTKTGGGGGITANAWNTATMNSGTVSLSHGDLIAVVWDMTARAGADSVTIRSSDLPGTAGGTSNFPTTNAFVASAWQTTLTAGAGRHPNVIIVFDDGTLGWIDFTIPFSVPNSEGFVDGTNPDERGLLFQVPWDCKVDALWMTGATADANADFTLKLYSDPTGTPAPLASVAVLAEQAGVAANVSFFMEALASEISLSKDTNYAMTVLATGTGVVQLNLITLGNEAHRASLPGGTTLAKVTRNNSTGAFTAESPAVTMYMCGVRISAFTDSAAAAGGGAHILGGTVVR